jgi:CubicO group peptidase (beta-lactamase class C family)
MGSNHIPVRLFPLAIGHPMPGVGFGLGFSVIMDVPQIQILGSVGTLGWGGAASTTFWVDPQEDLIAILMTQVMDIDPFSLQPDFRNLVYQALID